jgi:hypothetical protein
MTGTVAADVISIIPLPVRELYQFSNGLLKEVTVVLAVACKLTLQGRDIDRFQYCVLQSFRACGYETSSFVIFCLGLRHYGLEESNHLIQINRVVQDIAVSGNDRLRFKLCHCFQRHNLLPRVSSEEIRNGIVQ